MADIAKTTTGGIAAGVALTWTACDNTDQTALFKEGDILVIKNTGAGSHAVTVYSAPVPGSGRLANITSESIAAGAQRIYGPYPSTGWRQSDGKLKFKGNHAELLAAVITAP